MPIAPEAQLDDGLIDVIAIRDGDSFDLASLTANFVFSDFRQHTLVIYRQVSQVTIKATGPMPVTIDGDVITDQPISIAVLPQKVKLVRPSQTESFRSII